MAAILTLSEINKRKPSNCILTAIKYNGVHTSISGNTRSLVLAKCECGNTTNAIVCDLLRGKKISCGCKKGRKKKEGTNKRLYKIWYAMIKRCNDINNKYYGAKGVKVCDEWKDYMTFKEWAENNGYTDKTQIDKDINGNGLLYSPKTCLFVTPYRNVCNRSTSKKYRHNNDLLTLSEIAYLEKLSYVKLKNQIYGHKRTLLESIAICKENVINKVNF